MLTVSALLACTTSAASRPATPPPNIGSFASSFTPTFKQLGSGHILEVEVSRR